MGGLPWCSPTRWPIAVRRSPRPNESGSASWDGCPARCSRWTSRPSGRTSNCAASRTTWRPTSIWSSCTTATRCCTTGCSPTTWPNCCRWSTTRS
ncbi:hypothetical protein NKH77_04600 [Streptomyces sp. M19]